VVVVKLTRSNITTGRKTFFMMIILLIMRWIPGSNTM
jgi:hypothetical protein